MLMFPDQQRRQKIPQEEKDIINLFLSFVFIGIWPRFRVKKNFSCCFAISTNAIGENNMNARSQMVTM